jgi:Fur family transcriptional regulator, ferric uptake regulator
MIGIHNQEKDQFQKLFAQEHIDRTEDRFKILDAFLQTEGHVTEKELRQRLEEKGLKFESEFIRETLKLMCRFGFAQKQMFDNGVVRYEHLHLGQHHDHIICTKCKKITEFENPQMEQLQTQIAGQYGFHILQHKMEIYGICSDCLKERMNLMPLVFAKPGERMVIKEISGGTSSKMRLLSMGLRIGDEIEVITNLDKGQVVVAANYNRYAIGRGLAQKIMAEPIRKQGRS